jgi:hypothetical protein
MKVYINQFRNHWISPYTLIDLLFFWTHWSQCHRSKEMRHAVEGTEVTATWTDRPAWVKLTHDKLLIISKMVQKILDLIHPKIDFVKIDRWDTWNMDCTLAVISLPMLRQLKSTNQAAPMVDDEDVPEELKSTMAPLKENEYDIDANHFKRWDWVLSEMIFAFECKLDPSWQDKFSSGEIDKMSVPIDRSGNEVPKSQAKLFRWEDGPNHTYQCDYAGMRLVELRIQNGFCLFGRYYQNLWD